MKFYFIGFTVLALAGVSSSIRADGAKSAPIAGTVPAVPTEPGVVPPGTSLVVRTNDTVSTRKALRDTIYDASVAEDVLDKRGSVLIPKESSVELGVVSLSFLGPGGAGMTELVLGIREVTVNGVRYPVQTVGNAWDRNGGLEEDRHTAKSVGGGEAGQVFTHGSRIQVPRGMLLAFHTDEPIRLKGYQR